MNIISVSATIWFDFFSEAEKKRIAELDALEKAEAEKKMR